MTRQEYVKWLNDHPQYKGRTCGQCGDCVHYRAKSDNNGWCDEWKNNYEPYVNPTWDEHCPDYVKREKSTYSKSHKSKTYLMSDRNVGYTKIGKSVNPRQREKTLQAEKPTITMFAVCENDVEKKLHIKYANKRIRGEWFDLTQEDIDNIISEYAFEFKD